MSPSSTTSSTPSSTPQFSDIFRQKLHEESQHWVDENLLSPEQRNAILRHCENVCDAGNVRQDGIPDAIDAINADKTKEKKEFPLFLQVILAVGFLFVGLAVLLLISFNWQYLPGAAKLSLVGTLLAAAHAGGFALRKAGRKFWADGVFFFAGMMYGVGIWQIGQVFNMPADLPAGLYLWAAGVFLLALALASTPLHIASVLLLAAWLIAEVSGTLNVPHAVFNTLFGNVIPLSDWSLPLFAAVGIIANVLPQKKFTATLYVFLLVFWWIMQGFSCRTDKYMTFHIAAAGLVCFALSSGRFRSISHTALERIGFLLFIGGVIAPSYQDYVLNLRPEVRVRRTSLFDVLYRLPDKGCAFRQSKPEVIYRAIHNFFERIALACFSLISHNLYWLCSAIRTGQHTRRK